MFAASLLASPVRAVELAGDAEPFGWDRLVARAKAVAEQDFVAPAKAPGAFIDLSYDEHRDIRFRSGQSLWSEPDQPFRAQFFHPGWQYAYPVQIHEVEGGSARRILFDRALFDYGETKIPESAPETVGFAGFRLHYPLNRPDYRDEVVAFLGASYFRALGRGHQYGISARGLAIDTAESTGEEFPVFRRFWLERPASGAGMARIWALLDSPSVAGAYEITVVPGDSTVCNVRAALFFRRRVKRLGIAPLTSMFLHGGTTQPTVADFRPEVHDSDGLQVHSGDGEWLWRPLGNPSRLRQSVFTGTNPGGFGLMQRKRDFAAYQDLEAAYQKRPSLWIEPVKPFGRGAVHLVEIPVKQEYHDNIVAFWAPIEPPKGGQRLDLEYRMHWCSAMEAPKELAKVVATRAGAGGHAGEERSDGRRKFVVDFAGAPLAGLPKGARVEAAVETADGQVFNILSQPNPAVAGWRASFDVEPKGSRPVELRCVLKSGDRKLSETWSYQWLP